MESKKAISVLILIWISSDHFRYFKTTALGLKLTFKMVLRSTTVKIVLLATLRTESWQWCDAIDYTYELTWNNRSSWWMCSFCYSDKNGRCHVCGLNHTGDHRINITDGSMNNQYWTRSNRCRWSLNQTFKHQNNQRYIFFTKSHAISQCLVIY